MVTAELSIWVLYSLYSKLNHHMCWCDFLLRFASFWCFIRRKERGRIWFVRRISHLPTHTAACFIRCLATYHSGCYIFCHMIKLTYHGRKIKVIHKHQQPYNCVPQINCDWWIPEVWELPSRAHLAYDRPRGGGGCHQQSRPPASSCGFHWARAS